MMNNTITLLKSHGMLLLQMACHFLELMPKELQTQSIQLRIVTLKFCHTTKEITLLMVNNTLIHQRRLGMSLLQMACHLLELMLKEMPDQSTPPRIVTLKFSPITREITLSTANNTLIHQRRLGTSPLLMVCHWLAHMLKGMQDQFTQLKTATPKFSHIIREIMPSTVSSTPTHLKRLGMNHPQMVCH
jgi:hypothetical protein